MIKIYKTILVFITPILIYGQNVDKNSFVSNNQTVNYSRISKANLSVHIQRANSEEQKGAMFSIFPLQSELDKLMETAKEYSMIHPKSESLKRAIDMLSWVKKDRSSKLQSLYDDFEKEIFFYKTLVNEFDKYQINEKNIQIEKRILEEKRQFTKDSTEKVKRRIKDSLDNIRIDSTYKAWANLKRNETIHGTVVVGPGYSSTTNRTYSKSSRPKTQNVSSYGRKSKSGKTTYVKSYKRSRKR